MDSIISLQGVTREYVLNDLTVVAPVNNLNLDIDRGEFIAVTGRSGSGKTTLLNLIAGLIRPTRGQVLFGGVHLQTLRDRELASLRNRSIGFVLQFPSLVPSLTALENVVMPASFGHRGQRANSYVRAAGLLDAIGLSQRAGSYPRQLSAGEQKRVVIARALMNSPSVLLADEPTADLDVETEQRVMDMLREVHLRGTTVVLAAHSLALLPHTSRALKMENGLVRQLDPPDQIIL